MFNKSCRLWDNVQNVCRAEQATADNMAHAHCMLDTKGYKCTHSLCNTHCFSTVKMLARTFLSVTSYVLRLSSYPWYYTKNKYESIHREDVSILPSAMIRIPQCMIVFQNKGPFVFFVRYWRAPVTAVAQWLRCCATNLKVAGSIPAGVSGFFIDIKSFRSNYGPGIDLASNRNEYQEYILGVKAAGA